MSIHRLFLNLASNDALVACVTDQNMVASASLNARISDHELLPMTEDVLKKAGWSYQDLTQIACVVGPGGFTSLRVAVALANVLSHELKVYSFGIHLSDVYFARRSAEIPESPLTHDAVWLHSTKKNELFIRESSEEPRCITIEELKTVIKKGMLWAGELIPEHQQI